MKKTILNLLILTLVFVSCGKKEAVRPDTASGLTPGKFVTITTAGDTTDLYVLKNAAGMEVCVTNTGARIVSVMVPDKSGQMQNVVLGYDNIEPYMQLTDYLGATVGRYANRISNGTFTLDRVAYRTRANEGGTTLHGGPRGFSTQYFDIVQTSDNELTASYFSKANEEGFPGNLNVSVSYKLTSDNALAISYEATTDRATVINLTNHSYFNLSGASATGVADHLLFMDAAEVTAVDANLIPTGKFEKVKNTPLDFAELKAIQSDYSYDINYVLNKPGDIQNMAAKLVSASTGIRMEVYTTEPGIQLYVDKARPSFCLETQHFPDSPNRPEFPTTILRVDSVFQSNTIYKFGIEK